MDWIPKTELGRMVRDEKLKDISEVMSLRKRIMETEIVDTLLPELNKKKFQDVLDVNMVQRMTDSGRRVKFTVQCAVGNKNGYVGLGEAKSKEVGPAIRKAIDNAKLNLIQVRRGCGSWECACKMPHTIPFKVTGRSSSVTVTLKPAPRGLGLAIGEVGKKILQMAGIRDIWSESRGQTQTKMNFAKAVFDALLKVNEMSIQGRQVRRIGIKIGEVK
ncbi:MAG: 30S ribosomal protein S5 [Candidatus Methanofastidiosia archaeon]